MEERPNLCVLTCTVFSALRDCCERDVTFQCCNACFRVHTRVSGNVTQMFATNAKHPYIHNGQAFGLPYSRH